jgi:hypothetical protein
MEWAENIFAFWNYKTIPVSYLYGRKMCKLICNSYISEEVLF